MAAATQSLRMDNNPIKQKTETELPRIDLAKLDNIPYYIESMYYYIYVFGHDLLRGLKKLWNTEINHRGYSRRVASALCIF